MNEENTHIQIKRDPTHFLLMSAKNLMTRDKGIGVTYDDVINYALKKAFGKDSNVRDELNV